MELVSLNGRWQFRHSGQGAADWLEATVPGCVHTDLLANGAIPDPYYRDNEQQVLWVGETDWEYRRTFSVLAEMLDHDQILLCCEGLDTLGTIWLNDHAIGQTDNMFRRWDFDARPYLAPGDNEIVVRFDSALRFGQAKLAERYIHSWSTDTHKLSGGNYVREAQCNFGWDWGPKLVTCGIWRNISLQSIDTARLVDVQVRQDHSSAGKVELSCHAQVERFSAAPLRAAWRVELSGKLIAAKTVDLLGDKATAHLSVADPQLWLPNGLGEQPLYDVSLTLVDEGDGRLGICVWQDFMFGCATYPTFDDRYMANVAEEARYNIRRLRHHASLVL